MISKAQMNRRAPRLALFLIIMLACAFSLCACASSKEEMQDGYYTAEAAEFDAHGWKEFVIICVSDHNIVSVDYDAKNQCGLIKSWDMKYMRLMNATDGTYPNEYTRIYSQALLNKQSPDGVDVVTGATTSHGTFVKLAQAAIANAKAGDQSVAFVTFPQ